ncbi:MAG: iron-containing alcohol dehydrogenase [Pelotomaculum sp.]|uniref:Alcohol dehydrogenase n=1 Tax=Pelotomaculum thermopropionicum (strain DSM 13744 / JCM 10971 / SI) TaxID=370438 RepID=A5D4Z8_PELTS|nr:iron-containing alcohol dehydrogenase [Pelotomaculum sp.]BAF58676.1 alcohol dehydrogenase [Pelotomaculum thermopropionicum SI]
MADYNFSFAVRTKVFFGRGVVFEQLPGAVREMGCKKAVLVSDPGIVGTGLADRVKDLLAGGGVAVEVFSEVEPDPGLETVHKAAAFLGRTRPDCLVALGGGSSIDVAKGARVIYDNGGKISDYAGVNKVKVKPSLPLMAVPTTAGTGSEVTVFAVLSDWEQNIKITVTSEYLAPEAAFVDPLAMVSAPPGITAASGIDALSHAVEAYVSRAASPVSDNLALGAVELIGGHLRQAVANGGDLAARTGAALGSLLAGMAFNNAFLGLTHSIGAALSGHVHVSHGVAVGLLLPYVMEYNLMAKPDKFARLARAMGEVTEGKSLYRAASLAPRAVKAMVKSIGLPVRLKEIGVPEGALAAIAETALKHGMIKFNPRVPSREDILDIVKKAY